MLVTSLDFDKPGKRQGFLQVPYSHNLGGWANVMIPITVVARGRGPTVLVLGLGLLIHGRGIPTSGATRLTRIYGFAGGVAAIVSLHLLGYFARPPRHRWTDLLYTALPFAMLLVWFLPSRVFGAPEAAAAPPTAPVAGPTNEPIDPK